MPDKTNKIVEKLNFLKNSLGDVFLSATRTAQIVGIDIVFDVGLHRGGFKLRRIFCADTGVQGFAGRLRIRVKKRCDGISVVFRRNHPMWRW